MALDLNQFNPANALPSLAGILPVLKIGVYILGVILLLGGVFIYLHFKKKNKAKGSQMKEIVWWEDVNGQLSPLHKNMAKEILIPGTSLRVFYIKETDMWLPRFTRGITNKLYYVAITPNKEIINFNLKSIGKDMKEAKLDYDHTDMRWAAENTKEFIKRNYKDKSSPWWKEFQGLITGIAYILVTTFCLGVILWMWRDLVNRIGSLMGEAERILGAAQAVKSGASGIAPVGVVTP